MLIIFPFNFALIKRLYFDVMTFKDPYGRIKQSIILHFVSSTVIKCYGIVVVSIFVGGKDIYRRCVILKYKVFLVFC